MRLAEQHLENHECFVFKWLTVTGCLEFRENINPIFVLLKRSEMDWRTSHVYQGIREEQMDLYANKFGTIVETGNNVHQQWLDYD